MAKKNVLYTGTVGVTLNARETLTLVARGDDKAELMKTGIRYVKPEGDRKSKPSLLALVATLDSTPGVSRKVQYKAPLDGGKEKLIPWGEFATETDRIEIEIPLKVLTDDKIDQLKRMVGAYKAVHGPNAMLPLVFEICDTRLAVRAEEAR